MHVGWVVLVVLYTVCMCLYIFTDVCLCGYYVCMYTFTCRHSIEHLWSSLSEQNPNLLSDFEEFVAEVASEVQVAQRALE